MSIIALHSALNISETVRDRGFVAKDHQWEMAYRLSFLLRYVCIVSVLLVSLLSLMHLRSALFGSPKSERPMLTNGEIIIEE